MQRSFYTRRAYSSNDKTVQREHGLRAGQRDREDRSVVVCTLVRSWALKRAFDVDESFNRIYAVWT